ncbi:MAG: hypothetical protein ACD_20C00419G0013 [uncultured bacterium]|nr:MAG: hypothetical protein ACD_20C00419G0013 [uncultured bacterium]
MGLASSQIRLLYLTMFRSDLEYKIQLITQTKLHLSGSINELVSVGTDLDPKAPEMKLLEQRRERLYLVEKKLDATIERYKTQLKAIENEIEGAQKFVDNSVKSFNYAK